MQYIDLPPNFFAFILTHSLTANNSRLVFSSAVCSKFSPPVVKSSYNVAAQKLCCSCLCEKYGFAAGKKQKGEAL